MTWLQEYESLLLAVEKAARTDYVLLEERSKMLGLYYDDNIMGALKDLDRFRERTITDGVGFAVEQLKTCQHRAPCYSREDGQDVEPCREAATARVRWYNPEAKKWDDWLYLCEQHHAQVVDEMENPAHPSR